MPHLYLQQYIKDFVICANMILDFHAIINFAKCKLLCILTYFIIVFNITTLVSSHTN